MKKDKAISDVYQRIRYFNEPFAYICLNNQVENYCSYCLRKPDKSKLYKCSKCELARYCNKECQRLAWKKYHRMECQRLEVVYPNLPLTEILFLSRIIDKILFIEQYVHTNTGDEIGLALDLEVSAYNHSCRPNCSLVFDGFHAYLRPLTSETNAADPRTAFISYIDIGRSRYQRQKELKLKWYFDCRCDRCVDSSDDILTSIRCINEQCDEALIITEDSNPTNIICSKCKQITSEDHNIYVTRLKAALLHFTGSLKDNLLFVQKSVYENYRLCFPRSDRHVAYQLLHIVKSLIDKGERKEAVSYAYEAMSIFEVCFGLNHPYYLQTLALWTFLDKNIPKTNEELFALMNFQSNKPVDLLQILTKNLKFN
ncbi:Histone-lysine N-methyltransferase SMYD3 [Dirofilaria immitis]|nr:Histone-lysine N-methyltransferase SMYD3 [Dirofilaria immitis]